MVGIHTFYVEDLLKEFRQSTVIIYGYDDIKSFGKNYFFIKNGYLKFLLSVDIFMSANLSDGFIKKSKKIYLNHHLYDSPLVNFEKEQTLCRRFSKYDIIFLSSQSRHFLGERRRSTHLQAALAYEPRTLQRHML